MLGMDLFLEFKKSFSLIFSFRCYINLMKLIMTCVNSFFFSFSTNYSHHIGDMYINDLTNPCFYWSTLFDYNNYQGYERKKIVKQYRTYQLFISIDKKKNNIWSNQWKNCYSELKNENNKTNCLSKKNKTKIDEHY